MNKFDKIKDLVESLAKENRLAVAMAIIDQAYKSFEITENELSILCHKLNDYDWSKCPVLGKRG